MKKLMFGLAVAACAAAFAQPASPTTFPTLTTIYVGAGVRDDGGAENVGIATTAVCSNVSGVTTTIRFLVLDVNGEVVSALSFNSIGHGQTLSVSTHATTTFVENFSVSSGAIGQGVINIESLQSGVFCTAFIVDAADAVDMAPIHLVRINPHPARGVALALCAASPSAAGLA